MKTIDQLAFSTLFVFALMTISAMQICFRGESLLSVALTKAANVARMRAESLNGGVSSYRADHCMYMAGAEGCLLSSTDAGFMFRFRGGPPGWQQLSPPQPTVETKLLVSPDGEQIRDVVYNGPLQ